MSTNYEHTGDNNEKEPIAPIYKDGRIAVLPPNDVESLPEVDGYQTPELKTSEAREAEAFLQYAVRAAMYLERNAPGHTAYDHPDPERANPLIAFEYNGIRFAVEVHTYRYEEPDFYFVSMQAGDQVSIKLSNTEDILGRSENVEYLRGFAGVFERDDPLSQLSRDPNAEVTVTSSDELGYILRLEARDVHVSNSPNLHVAPSDTAMAVRVGRLSGATGLSLSEKTVGDHIQPAREEFDPYTLEVELKIILEAHPNLRRVLLDSISAISLDEIDFDSYERRDDTQEAIALKSIVNAAVKEVEKGVEVAENNVLEFLSKLDVDSSKGIDILYSNVSRMYIQEGDDEKRALLVKTISISFPQFEGRVHTWLREQSVNSSESMTLGWLLSHKDEIAEMISLASIYKDELEYEDGRDPAITPHVVDAFWQIAQHPDHEITDEQRAALIAAGVDVELMTLAFQEAETSASRGSVFGKVGRMFAHGTIKERAAEIRRDAEIDKLLERIADFTDEEARSLLKGLLKKGDEYGSAKAGKLATELIAEVPDIHEARHGKAGESDPETEVFTAIDIGKLLANKINPNLEAFFASDYITSTSVNQSGVSFTIKPGTAPQEWNGPETNNIPVKHKIIELEGSLNTIILDYAAIRAIPEGGEYYKTPSASVTDSAEDGSFIVTVKF